MVYESVQAAPQVQSWIMGYIALCFASAGCFALLRRVWYAVPGILYVLHGSIVVWSGIMYLNFLYETPISHIAWYCDWMVSTPLIVLALALTAQFQRSRIAWDTTSLLMAAQFATIATGLLAHLTESPMGTYIWFTVGCATMCIVLYIIWFPMMRMAREHSRALHRKYLQLGTLIIVLWVAYPVVWILSPLGLAHISYTTTSILFIILPVICKPGFGFIDLYFLHHVARVAEKK